MFPVLRNMKWTMVLRGAGLALIALLTLALASAQEAITFTFNPPNGTVVVQKDTQSISETRNGKKDSIVAENTTRLVFKKTAQGFTMAMSPMTTSYSENGVKKPVPENPITKDMVLTYQLDTKGKLMSIDGLDDLQKKMEKQLSAEEKKNTPPDKIVKMLLQSQQEQWDADYNRYIGKTVKLGTVWSNNITVPFVFGKTVPAVATVKFAGRVTRNGHNCLRVLYSINVDQKKVKTVVNSLMAELKKEAATRKDKTQEALPTAVDMQLVATGERIIDPTTMLVYAESQTHTTVVRMTSKDKKTVSITTSKVKTTSYDYKK